jgi:hypothetical protein
MVHDLREDERELAGAILEGSKRRTDQAVGDYYRAAATAPARSARHTRASTVCPTRPTASARSGSIACSNASKAWCAPVPNAARRSCRWAWVADPDVPQDESHAHH